MQNWSLIRPVVAHVLGSQQYTNSGNYNGTPCFLTSYQIAVLVDRIDPTLRGNLPIGGADAGPDSFARQIAWHLSDDVNRNAFNGSLEIQFFSIDGLDDFTFDGGRVPSSAEFAMFRLTSLNAPLSIQAQ